jgi:hypothetical protein
VFAHGLDNPLWVAHMSPQATTATTVSPNIAYDAAIHFWTDTKVESLVSQRLCLKCHSTVSQLARQFLLTFNSLLSSSVKMAAPV